MGAVQKIDFHILNDSPPMVENLLAFDKIKLFFNRFIGTD